MPSREYSNTVVASPQDATETVICSITPSPISEGNFGDPCDVLSVVDMSIGPNGKKVTFRAYRDHTDLVATWGPFSVSGGQRRNFAIEVPGQPNVLHGWSLSAQVQGATGPSVIHNVAMRAIYW